MDESPVSARRQRDDLEYWTRTLGGELPVLDLPKDRPRPADPSRATRTVPLRVEADVVGVLKLLAEAEGATPFVVVLAAYTVFLAHMARQRDIVVGTSLPGDDTAAGQLGPPGTLVALRTVLDGTPTFRDVVRRVRETVREARDHRSVPLEQVVAELCVPRIPGVPPVVSAVFSLLPRADGAAGCTDAGAAGVTDAGAAEQTTAAAWDLSVALREDGDELAGHVEYSADLFDEMTVARFAAILQHLLGLTAAAPDEPVFGLSPLPPAERDRILHGLNSYQRPDIRYTTMAQPFEEQVGRTPDAVAVISDEGSLTYAAFNARANQLAWFLRTSGARPGTFVAVSMERSLDLMVALFAVAKTGAAYVPVDPELPDARMAFMLDDSGPVAVLVDRRTRSRIPAGPWQVLAVDDDAARWAAQPTHDVPPESGNHLIHLLYTSGTTGRPKAVAYPVDGALADIFWLHGNYPYRPGDTAILKTSYGFDVSIWEIFWPLYCGSRIAICPPGAHRDPVRLSEAIDRYQVTAMFMVPSMMQPVYDHAPAGSWRSLRWVFCGGEPITPRVRDGFHKRFDADLVNCYGPTELGCVAETVLPVEMGAPVVPVGRPPAHRRVYVLDDNLEPTPVGVAGELFVGGEVGIAQCYHRRPELTAQRFLPDPYGLPGGRMYRTGDLCRYRDDGVLEHLGRIGRQVKIRGMRIELAEIEAVIAEDDDVAQCVVTVVPDRGEIAAFVAPADGRSIPVPDLVARARRLLPAHMVPATVTVVNDIPTFVNGKIDFAALLDRIDRTGTTDQQPMVAPASVTEARVARIFCETLGKDAVSVTESFFVLGGHSLLVFQLIELCTAEFGVELAAKDVIEALSARELAGVISRRTAREGDPA